jgi:hemerythrin-like domain-containing protein
LDAAYVSDYAKLLDFFRVFVDKCHHAKEEEVLFPALLEAGLPREGGPVQVMLAEHDAGRKLVAEMSAALGNYRAGTPDAFTALAAAAQGYTRLLIDHIAKEDNILYPLADAKIPEPRQAGMIDAFEAIETERIGPGTHEQFHAMLKEFKAAYLG